MNKNENNIFIFKVSEIVSTDRICRLVIQLIRISMVYLLLACIKRVPLMTGFRSVNHISLESFTICPTARSNRRDRSTWKLSHQQRLINPVTLGTLKFCLVSIGESITQYLRELIILEG